jgi:hypothetical protein
MFTRKHVGPVDCASCERGIQNLNAMRVDMIHWNKLPFREPADRIAKVTSFSPNYIFLTVYLCIVWSRLQQNIVGDLGCVTTDLRSRAADNHFT